MAIETAQIHFNQQGTPVAEAFDDVYFSNADGLAETHYVFLHNNQLPARWQQTESGHFVIAETGFGTGLNFLASFAAFVDFRRQQPQSPLTRLFFISTEKFPLSREDLTRALAHWPQLSDYSKQLIQAYPYLSGGCHRLRFDVPGGEVMLDLWLGDLHDLLPQWHRPEQGLVDAWFLDGFAPSKNPDMWTDALFTQMASLARPDCTFATFTAAGFVKRGLQQAGFKVEKRKGFGHKRDMLAGHLATPPKAATQAPWFKRRASPAKTIAIVGGGLAAATLSYALCRRGYQVNLYSQGIADGASGNRQGGFYPQLHVDDNLASRLLALAFDFARREYQPVLATKTVPHDFCGVLQIAFTPALQEKQQKLAAKGHWPADLITPLDAQQATELAGIAIPYPALHMAGGGWINPQALTQALLAACGPAVKLHKAKQLQELHYDVDAKRWQLTWLDGGEDVHQVVVMATGAESVNLPLFDVLPLRPVRGQVEHIPSQTAYGKLKTVLCHKGYMTPALEGRHALGSTYVKMDMSCEHRESEAEQNLNTHRQAMRECDWTQYLKTDGQGRASIRLGLPDHLPLMGAMPDIARQKQDYAELYLGKKDISYPQACDLPGLYLFIGLGSRGLCSAPLLAETLASQLTGEPLPLDNSILAALSPNRFVVRDCQRKPVTDNQ